MKIIELLSVGNQNKTTNINAKSSNHVQSEYQHQINKKQQHGSKQHQDRQQELQRQRERQQQNQWPLRNFYEPLTPLIGESNVVGRPIVPGNTSYAGVLRKGKKCLYLEIMWLVE